eukprot:TRINITY_DN60551_c0_g1_i1.p1 TRINITY_DN60551_c0_g1~~TRINITY_DN60551_c0_g1_i1.p1  ORF type:complete len:437 (+),score=130.04 TRINITY_DN60551_c0_g1_i1:74-1312(+)
MQGAPAGEMDSDGFRRPPPPKITPPSPAALAMGAPPSPMAAALTRRESGSIRPRGLVEAAKRASDAQGVTHLGKAGVVDTNDDATAHKARAVVLGYWKDPYVDRFVRRADATAERSVPLINRGYFARVRFINQALEAFFAAVGSQPCQVLNLGCGYDTAYWRMARHGSLPETLHRWVEVDFPEVIAVKKGVVDACPELSRSLQKGQYQAVVGDLRDMPSLAATLIGDEAAPGPLRRDLPTIVISECVLVYLQPHEGDAVIRWCGEAFANCCFITYEQFNPDTPFGRTMVGNLEQRGCPLLSIAQYPSLQKQAERYMAAGFGTVQAHSMNEVWERTPFTERRRVDRIEMLDEVEEWRLIHDHYCFVCAAKCQPGSALAGWVDECFKKPPPPTLPDGRPLALPPHTPAGGIFID